MTDETLAREAVRAVLADLDRRGIAAEIRLGAGLAVLLGEMIDVYGPAYAVEQLRSAAAVLALADADEPSARRP